MLGPVRIRQYCYFSLSSPAMPATVMAERLELQPDDVMIRASRNLDPPRPQHHSWKVVCNEAGLTVDEQVNRLVARLAPHTEAIASLARELEARDGSESAGAHLQVVRFFDDEEGEEEELSPPEADFQKLAGQHQLLGWHVDLEVLKFLLEVGAELDVDEYG